jgi:hypothetical protein
VANNVRADQTIGFAGGTRDVAVQYSVGLELTAILHSEQFCHSQRSSNFLRYVVEQALRGQAGDLKERTIGVAVYGKLEDYDTAADACVRVRANDVRRRLGQYYDSHLPLHGVRIELKAGSYVPRFALQTAVESAPPEPPFVAENAARPLRMLPPPMSLWQLATPTAIAIFLAILAIRFGAEANDEYSRFWSQLLAHRTAIRVSLGEPDATGRLPQDLANSALPFSKVARDWQVPIVFASENSRPTKQEFEILLRIGPRQMRTAIDVDAVGQPNLQITGPSIDSIQSAINNLCSRQFFSVQTPAQMLPPR